MNPWIVYVKERFPLGTYLLLVGGLSLSGLFYRGGSFEVLPLAVSMTGLLLFFALLRLMDEYKDYAKDLIAHPERPLPRGLLDRQTVASVIRWGAWLMLVFACVASALNLWAGLTYLIVAVYLWLMYREFYFGAVLAKSPILYAITHQVILLPLAAFTVAITRGEFALSQEVMAWAVSILGSFFSYEICRKLDPEAPPILGTYLRHYGPAKTSGFVLVLSGLAATGACAAGLGPWLWPLEAILCLSLVILFKRPSKFKILEGVATLSLLVHLWVAFIVEVLT